MPQCLARLFFAVVMSLAASVAPASAAWPERPVSILIPWGAGGGADQLARALAPLLERELKVPINVVIRAGGSGAVGHVAIAQAAPDGYTWGLNTVEIAMLHWQGLSTFSPRDYTVAALFNADSGALVVKADGPYKSAKELLEVIRQKPANTLKASGTGQGGIWHLGLIGWLVSEKIDPAKVPWVPSQGSAPAVQDLAAGGVDFVVVSLPEARPLIDPGKLRPLANMDATRLWLYPDVPTMKEATGTEFIIQTWRGIVGPKGIPEEAVTKMRAALKKAFDDKIFQDFLKARGFNAQWIEGQAAMDHMTKASDQFGVLMKEAGLIK
jgi:putative tricarboxylic transport membrane protein